jgi:hypothetical protein
VALRPPRSVDRTGESVCPGRTVWHANRSYPREQSAKLDIARIQLDDLLGEHAGVFRTYAVGRLGGVIYRLGLERVQFFDEAVRELCSLDKPFHQSLDGFRDALDLLSACSDLFANESECSECDFADIRRQFESRSGYGDAGVRHDIYVAGSGQSNASLAGLDRDTSGSRKHYTFRIVSFQYREHVRTAIAQRDLDVILHLRFDKTADCATGFELCALSIPNSPV